MKSARPSKKKSESLPAVAAAVGAAAAEGRAAGAEGAVEREGGGVEGRLGVRACRRSTCASSSASSWSGWPGSWKRFLPVHTIPRRRSSGNASAALLPMPMYFEEIQAAKPSREPLEGAGVSCCRRCCAASCCFCRSCARASCCCTCACHSASRCSAAASAATSSTCLLCASSKMRTFSSASSCCRCCSAANAAAVGSSPAPLPLEASGRAEGSMDTSRPEASPAVLWGPVMVLV
mmetsp:Transcript_25301/g.68739  ORF Transcript_25301/g.68739 Transcript_25301/m.68739 type:complete len:235 (+) Transcript_25301:323-1027(+)